MYDAKEHWYYLIDRAATLANEQPVGGNVSTTREACVPFTPDRRTSRRNMLSVAPHKSYHIPLQSHPHLCNMPAMEELQCSWVLLSHQLFGRARSRFLLALPAAFHAVNPALGGERWSSKCYI